MQKNQEKFFLTEKHLQQYDSLLKLKDERLLEQEIALKKERGVLTEQKKKFLASKSKLKEDQRKLQEQKDLLEKKYQALQQESLSLDKKREDFDKLIIEYNKTKQDLEKLTEKQEQISHLSQESLIISRENETQRPFDKGFAIKTEGDEDFSHNAFQANDDLNEKIRKIQSKEKKLKDFEKSLLKLKEKFTQEHKINYEILEKKTEALRAKELNLHAEKTKVREAQIYLNEEIASIERIKSLLKTRDDSPLSKKNIREGNYDKKFLRGRISNDELPWLTLNDIKEKKGEDNTFPNTETLEEFNVLKRKIKETENKLQTAEKLALCLNCDNRVVQVSVLEFENRKTENEELKRHLEEAALSIQDFEDNKSQLDSALSDLKSLKSSLSIKETQLSSTLTQLDIVKQNLDSALFELSCTKNELNHLRLSSLSKPKTSPFKQDNTYNSDISYLKSQLSIANSEANCLKATLDKKSLEIEFLSNDIKNLQQTQDTLKSEIKTLKNKESSLIMDNAYIKTEYSNTKVKLSAAKQKIERLENELKSLTEPYQLTPPPWNISPQIEDDQEFLNFFQDEKYEKNAFVRRGKGLDDEKFRVENGCGGKFVVDKCDERIFEGGIVELECCKKELAEVKEELKEVISENVRIKEEIKMMKEENHGGEDAFYKIEVRNTEISLLNDRIEAVNKELRDGKDETTTNCEEKAIKDGISNRKIFHEKAKSLPWSEYDTNKEVKKLQEHIKGLNKTLESLCIELEHTKISLQVAEEMIEKRDQEIEDMQNLINALKDKIKTSENSLAIDSIENNLKAEISSLKSELAYTKNQLDQAQIILNPDASTSIINQDHSCQTCTSKAQSLEQELEKVRTTLQSSNAELESTQNALINALNDLQSSREEIFCIRNELMSCQAELLNSNTELFSTKNDLELAFLLVDSYKKGKEFEENPKYNEIIYKINTLYAENAMLKLKISQQEHYIFVQANNIGNELERLLGIKENREMENEQIRVMLDIIRNLREYYGVKESEGHGEEGENDVDRKKIKLENRMLKGEKDKYEEKIRELMDRCENLQDEVEKHKKVNEDLRNAVVQDNISENCENKDLNLSVNHRKNFSTQFECLQAELEEELVKLRTKEKVLKELQEKMEKERVDLKNDAECLKKLAEDLEYEKSIISKEKEGIFVEKFKIATINLKLEEKNGMITEKEKEILLFKEKLEERERLVSIKEKAIRPS